MNTQLSKYAVSQLSREQLIDVMGDSKLWSDNYVTALHELQNRNYRRDRKSNIVRKIEMGIYSPEEAIQMGKLSEAEAIEWGLVAEAEAIELHFDHAEFEVSSMSDAQHFVKINPNMAEEAILCTARDLVYATRGRGTMYLDSIQDIVDWIASSGIWARAHLGQWHKSAFGYTLCAMVEFPDDTAIDLWIYALPDDNGNRYSHVVLIGNEYTLFEEQLIADHLEANIAIQVGVAIRLLSYVRSRLLRGLTIAAHLDQLYSMIADIYADHGQSDPCLNLAWRAMANGNADYRLQYAHPSFWSDLEYCVLRDISEAINFLSAWRSNYRRN